MLPWGPPEPSNERHLDRFDLLFCTDDCRVSLCLTMKHHFPLKIAPSHGGSGPHIINGSMGPPVTRVLNPNGISIGSAVFVGLTSVTDGPTDHANRSVTIDRIYVRSTGDAIYQQQQ